MLTRLLGGRSTYYLRRVNLKYSIWILSSLRVGIQGHLSTFLPKKLNFSSKCACISSTILTFLPINPLCFYTKNSQKVNFSSNCAFNTGHFIDISPKKSDFFLKIRLYIVHYFDFLPNNPERFSTKIPKKLIFPQIATIIQGTLLTFLPKKVIFSQNSPAYRALLWLFYPIIQCVFTPKTSKKLIFPQIAPKIQGTLFTFLPKKVIFSQNAPAYRALFWLFCPIIHCVFTPKMRFDFRNLRFGFNLNKNWSQLKGISAAYFPGFHGMLKLLCCIYRVHVRIFHWAKVKWDEKDIYFDFAEYWKQALYKANVLRNFRNNNCECNTKFLKCQY